MRKGIVKAERGPTRDNSPYLTALSAVTVAIALSIAEAHRTHVWSKLSDVNVIKKSKGNTTIPPMNLPPYASVYSFRVCFLLGLVSILPAKSHKDFKRATTRDNMIQSIIFSFYNTFFL